MKRTFLSTLVRLGVLLSLTQCAGTDGEIGVRQSGISAANVTVTGPDTATIGDTVTYTVVLHNPNGAAIANLLVENSSTPDILQNVTWTCAGAGVGVDCPSASGYGATLSLSQLTGTDVTVKFTGTILISTLATTLTNTATATYYSGALKLVGSNNAFSNLAAAPATVSVTSPNSNAAPGTQVTYTVTITNPNASGLGNIVASYAIVPPANLTNINSTLPGGPIYIGANSQVSYTITGTIAPAATGSVEVDLTTATSGVNRTGSFTTTITGGVDAGTDSGVDSGTDAADSADSADSGLDTAVDSSVDTAVDTGSDTGIDTGVDTGYDAGIDTGVDTGYDAGIDTGRDTGVDTALDTARDTGVDSSVDLGVDTSVSTDATPNADSATDSSLVDALVDARDGSPDGTLLDADSSPDSADTTPSVPGANKVEGGGFSCAVSTSTPASSAGGWLVIALVAMTLSRRRRSSLVD